LQGCLCRSRWFLGALAAVSTKQRLLLHLLVSDEHADAGLYTFQFYKHGAWRRVVVDNRLPCLEVQQRLAFASSSTPQVGADGKVRAHAHHPQLSVSSIPAHSALACLC
jgi:hypothetical protein